MERKPYIPKDNPYRSGELEHKIADDTMFGRNPFQHGEVSHRMW